MARQSLSDIVGRAVTSMDRVHEIIDREQAQLRMLMLAMILFALSLLLMHVRESKLRYQAPARPERTSSDISLQRSSPHFQPALSTRTIKPARKAGLIAKNSLTF